MHRRNAASHRARPRPAAVTDPHDRWFPPEPGVIRMRMVAGDDLHRRIARASPNRKTLAVYAAVFVAFFAVIMATTVITLWRFRELWTPQMFLAPLGIFAVLAVVMFGQLHAHNRRSVHAAARPGTPVIAEYRPAEIRSVYAGETPLSQHRARSIRREDIARVDLVSGVFVLRSRRLFSLPVEIPQEIMPADLGRDLLGRYPGRRG